jgi:hypothetical protein
MGFHTDTTCFVLGRVAAELKQPGCQLNYNEQCLAPATSWCPYSYRPRGVAGTLWCCARLTGLRSTSWPLTTWCGPVRARRSQPTFARCWIAAPKECTRLRGVAWGYTTPLCMLRSRSGLVDGRTQVNSLRWLECSLGDTSSAPGRAAPGHQVRCSPWGQPPQTPWAGWGPIADILQGAGVSVRCVPSTRGGAQQHVPARLGTPECRLPAVNALQMWAILRNELRHVAAEGWLPFSHG